MSRDKTTIHAQQTSGTRTSSPMRGHERVGMRSGGIVDRLGRTIV